MIVLTCGTVGLVYVFLQNGFEGTSVKSLLMALAYCWALIQAIYLMGHGLVAFPRRLFRNANLSGTLQRIQIRAPKTKDRLTDSIIELDELEAQLTQLRMRKNGVSGDHQEWIEDLADISSLPESRSSQAPPGRVSAPPMPAIITDRYLAELTRKLNRARHKQIRFIEAWHRLVQEAGNIQAIMDASASKKLDFGRPSPAGSLFERTTLLTPYTRYILYFQIVPAISVVSGGFFSLASICIIFSELVKYVAPQLSIVSLTVVHRHQDEYGQVGFAGQVIAALWILYMCATALASFDDVKIWGNRALVRRNTYGESACWYAGQIAKLTVPLSYNFITFLPLKVHRETTFYHFLGRLIVLTPLGKGFDYFFPALILIPVCATLFNLYGRVKNTLGYGVLEDDEEDNPTSFGTGGWREGRDLIERELNGRSGVDLSTPTGDTSAPDQASRDGATHIGRLSTRHLEAPSQIRQSDISTRPPPQQTDVTQRQAQRLAAATQAAEEEDENAFSGFAHRVRNTFENVERPEWFSDLGKRPKWMGGYDGNNDTSGRADSGRGFGRWFGGRPSDSRVRL